MKAIFEHNGFTRMEDLPGDTPPPSWSMPVDKPLKMNAVSEGDVFLSTVKIWLFILHGVEYVDGEMVAIYKFEDEK